VRIICLDAETFYGDDYTLSKMTTEAYVRDKRFECHGWAVKWSPNTSTYWYDDRQARYIFAQEDWSDTAIICHHAQFDGLILSHHYGIVPKLYLDTLSCARLLLGNHLSVGLDALAKHFGLAAKTVPYNAFRNMHWNQLGRVTQQQVVDGACHDVDLTWTLFKKLGPQIPKEEWAVMDTVIRMFVNPVLRADTEMLAQIWEREENGKALRLAELGVEASELASAEKFASLLRDEGVEPATKDGKVDPKIGKPRINYQFAKTDPFMEDLREHDSPRVRALAEARLGEKSTLMQTRAETLGWMDSRGPLCVYLKYAGASTLRVSGGDGANWLNFKRGSDMRKAIMAPEGYLLAPVDASQIEFRVCMYLAGQEDVIEQLRNGEDPYLPLACEFYGEKIYKPTKDDPRRLEMEQKRGASKQANLMCIYGAAGEKFQKTARAGLYGPRIDMSIEDADRFVDLFRRTHPKVCDRKIGYWGQAEVALRRLAEGSTMQWGPLTIRDHRIYLPAGQPLIYDTLEWHVPGPDEDVREFELKGFWRMRTRHGWKKMWGSKLVQNICEAVSRVIVSRAMNRITAKGFRVLNWPYDELLILLANDGQQEYHLQECIKEFEREVSWLPGLPLAAEGSLGERYSK
jgi:hypothetical protein